MRNCTLLVVAFAGIMVSPWESAAADEPPVQALEWNVFLGDWQLLGPFPKDDADPTGLETKFVADEAGLQGGQVCFYENKLYVWKPHDGRVVQFRKAFKVQGPAGDNAVAYAWTRFTSSVARKAVLAVGYDDMLSAWVNGKEVGRGTANWASSLDQERREVELRAGVNTLLLKVGNGTRAWDAAARFLPAGLDEPLLTFRCQPGGDISRLPTVQVTLVDAQGETISEHRCSGGRKSWPGVSGYYALYAAPPDPPPAAVRFVVREPGFLETETQALWKRATSGNVALPLAADRPLELLVVDQGTRQPIAAAEVWTRQVKEPSVSDAQGRITLPEFNPMTHWCWVVARGYSARRMNVAWPHGKRQRVELAPGGRTVTGTVRSTAGQPLAGATVKSGLAGYAPQTVTDENGRFELFGLPEATDHIYPTVTCPGFLAKDSFSFALGDGPVTDVVWELEPGATVAGRVTHQETGAPLAGVTVTVGDDRFGGESGPTTKTNADGRYELTGVPPGAALVHAFSDHHAPAMQTLTARLGETAAADFRLADGKPVTGVVTDPAGVPLAGVRLVTDTWNAARMFNRETQTDNQGRFTLPHMPETPAEVHVLKASYISHRDFRVRGGDTVALTMKPVVVHTIRVRDAEKGQIVPDLQIAKGYLWSGNRDWQWTSQEWETTRYYNNLAGVLRLEIDEPFDYEIAYRFRAPGYQAEVVAIPRDADTGKQFEVRLKPAAVFEGRVVDASTGAALPGVTVAMVNSEDRLQSYFVHFVEPKNLLDQHRFTGLRAVTDSQGRFRLSTPTTKAATDLVLIGEHGGFHVVTDVDRVLRSEELRSEPLELPFPAAGSIEGRVVVADKPLANTHVHLRWLGHGQEDERSGSFGIGGRVTTDGGGRFRFQRLGPGRYRLNRVFSVDHGDGSSTSTYLRNEDVVLLPGETLVHDLVTPAGLSVSGVVRDAAGKPVGGCVLTATTTGASPERVAATRSDDNGRFVLEHLAPGTYTLSAEHYARRPEGYHDQDMTGTATVELTAARDDVTVDMTPIDRGQPRSTLRGSLAPEFSVTPVGAAEPFTLSEHFGRVVVVSFWGSWSDDQAGLRETFARYKDHEDVAFLTVFLQDEAQFRDFQKKQPVEFPVTTTGTEGNPVAARFGVWGNAVSFVIGRDGRFAAERLDGSQLAAAVEAAVSQPLDPALEDAAPLRVRVTLAADGGEQGVPGAKVALKAVDASGRTVREDQLSLTGKPREVVWRCPAVAKGGKVTVAVSGRGFEEQTQTQSLENPSAADAAKLRFVVPSPRKITGRVLTVDDGTPVAGMRVRIQSGNGETASTQTDADGRFTWPCFPGQHYLTAVGNARHAIATGQQSVNVQDAVDPAPVEWRASPAVTVQGIVVDKTGQPVAGATVLTQTESKTTTDTAGRFTLEGVAAVGMTQVYAVSGDVYGAVRLRDPKADETCRITLGQGLDEPGRDQATTLGGPVPPFEARTLDGEPIRWQPAAAKDRLLVLCALWHPESRAFVDKAERWAAEHGTEVELVSLDWSLEQTRRELKSADFSGRVLYAGPGSLRLGPSWPLSPRSAGRTALLVTSDGTLAAAPLEPSAP